jgi:hypothetical protein
MNLLPWAVGVTVAHRQHRTLEQTLTSLAAAGFPRPRIFSDGETEMPSGFDVTLHSPQIGAWPNFWLALTELVARQPAANAFLLVQDDVVFSRGTCDYVSQYVAPDDCGVQSLFCAACHNRGFGWHAIPVGYGMASAQALVFPRERAYEFLAHPWTVNHRRAAPKSRQFRGDGLHHIDGAVGEWCKRVQKKAYCHSPSLAQHIGFGSIMYPGFTGKRHRRFADSFPGELVNANQVYPKFAQDLATWRQAGGSEKWSIPGHLWAVIAGYLRPGMHTLETGSGLSTRLFLDAGCDHTSLEHDPQWADRLEQAFPGSRRAVRLCPLTGEPAWYAWTPPAELFDLVLIDGPPADIGREGILSVVGRLVHERSLILVDDAGRPRERSLCDAICQRLGWRIKRSTAGHFGYALLAKSF